MGWRVARIGWRWGGLGGAGVDYDGWVLARIGWRWGGLGGAGVDLERYKNMIIFLKCIFLHFFCIFLQKYFEISFFFCTFASYYNSCSTQPFNL